MNHQLNLTHQTDALNWNRLWLYSKIFLSFLIVITIISSFAEVPSVFCISNIALGILFIVVLLVLKFKKKQVAFIKFEDNNVYYFCKVKKEAVVIPASEIINVTTRFCELQIHTINQTHCINMDKIKQETQRWEIKEMIRKLALKNGNQACNF